MTLRRGGCFRGSIGRGPRRRDALAVAAARVGKWARDPLGTALRVRAALALPTRRVT